ncbi:hypothetical protein BpHYR1_031599 [Brachionus plicatilis]|uniref:Uncharacterized protein n=1 Tax=Brachionus plicatilis TaxID=10195 RepID=A0A3M7T017_BRAPC|nr:hypothetical protein BpHYR1_031599 [Brachionus plicatilis]
MKLNSIRKNKIGKLVGKRYNGGIGGIISFSCLSDQILTKLYKFGQLLIFSKYSKGDTTNAIRVLARLVKQFIIISWLFGNDILVQTKVNGVRETVTLKTEKLFL